MGDAGELIAAAAGLGVGHPPGAPTWTLLTHLFTKIPISNIAWRVNFASGVYAAFSCLLVFLVVREILRTLSLKKGWVPETVALASALTFGFTATIWANAVVAEVYTLMTLFSLLSFYTLLLWQKKKELKFMFLTGLLCSLGFGVHYQVALIFPALAVFVLTDWWKGKDYKALGKVFLSGLGGLLLGLLVFLYLPLAARSNPIINWGDPSTWQSFWDHVLRKQYSINDLTIAGMNLPFSNPSQTGGAWRRFLVAFKSLSLIFWWEFGLLLLPVVLGFVVLVKKARKKLPLLSFFTVFSLAVGVFSYLTKTDIPVRTGQFFDLVAFFPFLIIVSAFGIKIFLDQLKDNRFAILLLALPVFFLFKNFSNCDWSQNYAAQYFVKDTLDTAQDNPTLIFSGDLIFPFIYETKIESPNPDVRLYDRGGSVKPYAYNVPTTGFGENTPDYYRDIVQAQDHQIIENAPHNVYMLYQNECDPNIVTRGFLSVVKESEEPVPTDWENSYQEMLSLKPEDLTGDVFGQLIAASYHLYKGYWHYQNNELEKAEQELETAYLIGGEDNFSNINSVGACYFAIGKQEKGLEILKKASKARPNSAGIHYNLGLKLTQTGDFEEAADHFEKSLALNPIFLIRSGKNLGLVYVKLQQWDKAVDILERVYSADPQTLDYSISYGLGLSYLKLNQFDKAVFYLNRALELKKDNPSIMEGLAVALFDLKRYSEAGEVAGKLLKLDPQNKYASQIVEKLSQIE